MEEKKSNKTEKFILERQNVFSVSPNIYELGRFFES